MRIHLSRIHLEEGEHTFCKRLLIKSADKKTENGDDIHANNLKTHLDLFVFMQTTTVVKQNEGGVSQRFA